MNLTQRIASNAHSNKKQLKNALLLTTLANTQMELFYVLDKELSSKYPEKNVITLLLIDGCEMLIAARRSLEICAYSSAMALLRTVYDRLELVRYFDKYPYKIKEYLKNGSAPGMSNVMNDMFGRNTLDRKREGKMYKILCDFSHANMHGQVHRFRGSKENQFIVMLGYDKKLSEVVNSNLIKMNGRALSYEMEIIDNNGLGVPSDVGKRAMKMQKYMQDNDLW